MGRNGQVHSAQGVIRSMYFRLRAITVSFGSILHGLTTRGAKVFERTKFLARVKSGLDKHEAAVRPLSYFPGENTKVSVFKMKVIVEEAQLIMLTTTLHRVDEI